MPADTLIVLPTVPRTLPLAHRAFAAGLVGSETPTDWLIVADGIGPADLFALVSRAVEHVAISDSATRRGIVGAYGVGFQHFLAHPEYRYLHLLEDGAMPPQGYLDDLRAVLDAHPEFGWVGCQVLENSSVHLIPFCSLMTRAAAEAVQGLDPLFAPKFFDDADLYLRLVKAGFQPHGIATRVSHPEGETSRDPSEIESDRVAFQEKRALFAERWGQDTFSHAVIPIHLGCDQCGVMVPPFKWCAFCGQHAVPVLVRSSRESVSVCGECVQQIAVEVAKVTAKEGISE